MEYKTTGEEKVLIYKCNVENDIFFPSLEQQTINCSKCIGIQGWKVLNTYTDSLKYDVEIEKRPGIAAFFSYLNSQKATNETVKTKNKKDYILLVSSSRIFGNMALDILNFMNLLDKSKVLIFDVERYSFINQSLPSQTAKNLSTNSLAGSFQFMYEFLKTKYLVSSGKKNEHIKPKTYKVHLKH